MKYSIEQTDSQLIDTIAHIRYHLHFDRASQHLIRIFIEIDNTDQAITLVLPAWMPGSYKIREMASNQGNLLVFDDDGNAVPYAWKSKNTLTIEANGKNIHVQYVYFANERGVRTSHVNRFHAFIMPVAALMYVEGRQHEIHHVYFHHNRKSWKIISSPLSPVKSSFADNEPIILGALNYDILADSPIEIGNHKITTFTIGNAIHEIALITNKQLNIYWLSNQIKLIVETERQFWGELPYDRYVFMLLVGEGQRGGLEHARCNVSAVDPKAFSDRAAAQDMLVLLAHEYFHTWNIKRIRPVELGPFDYSVENYTHALWLAEGITSYYDSLLAYRCGFYNRDEYLGVVSTHYLERLARVPGRFAMSVRDSSFLAWIKLYSLNPDMNNRFPSYYLKGSIVAMMLDMYIIAQTDGEKCLDDGMRALWAEYKRNPEIGLTEKEILAVIELATSVPCSEMFMTWLNSTDELPYNDIFNNVGLKLSSSKDYYPTTLNVIGSTLELPQAKEDLFIGIALKEENGRLLVREIEDGSPAAEAGIGIDDEIISANGSRCQTSKSFVDAIQHTGTRKPATIVGSCDGILYTTKLLPTSSCYNYLNIMIEANPQQKKMLEVWLQR